MVSWLTGAYSGGTEPTRAGEPIMSAYNPATGKASMLAQFASAGTVDAEIITRVRGGGGGSGGVLRLGWGEDGYGSHVTQDFNASLYLTIEARIRTTEANRLPYAPSTPGTSGGEYEFGVSAWIASAQDFLPGVVPTPQQIRDKAYRFEGGDNGNDPYYGPTSGNRDLTQRITLGPLIFGPNLGKQEGKQWVLIVPTVGPWYGDYTELGTLTTPLAGTTYDSIGRALSFYWGRSPETPIITSPASSSIVPPNSTFSLSYTPVHADTVVGGAVDGYNRNLSGVQVQYAPRPTVENPSPTWIDLPIGNNGGTALGSGWAIAGSTAIPADSGAFLLLNNRTITVRAGSNVIHSNEGQLPAGDWQLRLRTFDYGHPFPATMRPRPSTAASALTPATFTDARYISPWSTPVTVSTPAQVPPPIPLSPIDSIAVWEGTTVTLKYQYRNTAVPPYAQASRIIQMRKVGDPVWTDVFNGASASAEYVVSGFTLEAGTQYEWRVQVEDTDGKESNYSPSATFWMVAAPETGDVRPLPSSTIDGATLGCGKHRAFVYRRGGKRRVGEIKNFSYLDWGRVRDDISTSKIVVNDWDVDCGNLLASLQAWAYEVVIFRSNGYSVERVWEGPITLLTYERDSVTIHAKDVMGYAYRRIIKQKMSDSGTGNGTTVVNRAMRVLQNVFAPDDPNVLPYLTPLAQSDDAMQYRSTPAYSRTAFEEVDDMAANSGLDYTCAGRSILLWGTKHRIGTLPEFKDEDLGAPPIVSEYGMSMANRYVVSDGNGVWGEATRLDVSGNDEIYGLVEMLSSSWASDSPDDSGTYTQAGLATIVESFEGFAERSISDRYSPGSPVVVRVPDNTTLNPGTVISIQQLVPGVVVPLRSTGTLRSVVANQKLDSMQVIEQNGAEAISITMSPFSRDDAEVVGEEA